MGLFGVQELLSTKSVIAPGWAYVPDTGLNPSVTALQPVSKKRAVRSLPNASPHEVNTRQDAKILRDLAVLDKESHKDVQIPVPVRHRDNAGRASHGKLTPGVRKILLSQKTFANHLSDAEALAALTSQSQAIPSPTPATRISPALGSTFKPQPTTSNKRMGKKRDPNATASSTPLRQVENANSSPESTPAPAIDDKTRSDDNNTSIIDAPSSLLKPLPQSLKFALHSSDKDPLLVSHIPPIPSDAELEDLITAPPLTYMEAKGKLTDEDLRRPTRSFCEICGYWGQVKCVKCRTRVCALECMKTHQDDCYTRYGV